MTQSKRNNDNRKTLNDTSKLDSHYCYVGSVFIRLIIIHFLKDNHRVKSNHSFVYKCQELMRTVKALFSELHPEESAE